MALLTKFYTVSTVEKARQAVRLGYLKYPGICFVGNSPEAKSIIWMNQDNEMEFIVGSGQITDIRYESNTLTFYHGQEILHAIPIGLSEDVVAGIVETIKSELNLDSYATSSEVVQLLDDKLGDIGERSVTEYVEDKINDSPIIKKTGTLFAAVNLSALPTGVYALRGQYQFGGLLQTVHTASGGELFYVEQLESGTVIAKCSGSELRFYNIAPNGDYSTDRTLTESWLKSQDYMPREEAREVIKDLITETVDQKVEQSLDSQLDARLDSALDNRITAITREEVREIF